MWPALRPPHWGTYSPDSDLTGAWTGTANASVSTLTAVGLGTYGASTQAFSSQRWAASGTKSVRVIPRNGSADAYVTVAGSGSSLTGLGVTFVPGQTYTVLVTAHLDAPQVNPSGASRAIRVISNVETVDVAVAPNVAGDHQLRGTFTVPPGATWCLVRLYGGINAVGGSGDVWWDNLAIVQGNYTGPWFDGGNSPGFPYVVTWAAGANASASTLTDTAPLAVSNRVYRNGVLIFDNLELNTTVVDPIPPLYGTTYQVEAISALPSEARTEVLLTPDPEITRQFWLNAGGDWGVVASFVGDVKKSRTVGVAKEVEYYAGRPLAVETFGDAITDDTKLSATLIQAMNSPQSFYDVVLAKTVVCFRDYTGRYFVSIGPVQTDAEQDVTAGLDVSLSTVDFEEFPP